MSDLHTKIEAALNSGDLKGSLTTLFTETLHWGAPQGGFRPISVDGETVQAVPVAQLSGIPVFRVDWPDARLPNVSTRRAIHKSLAPVHIEHVICYLTQSSSHAAFVWARKRDGGRLEMRTLPYEAGTPARTTIEQLGELEFKYNELGMFGPSIPAVIDKLSAAFDVEAVTKRFFDEYKAIFNILQADLFQQTSDRDWAHDYALQFLNRCMFLYFIQRKRWLGDDPGFLESFWRSYQLADQPTDTFFDRWLTVLFFEAFNNEKNLLNTSHRAYIPDQVRNVLWQAPYLNGGLFKKNTLDLAHPFTITDTRFLQVLTFLNRYNFTIAEDTPFDQEVAVDPEMIGKVYESLVNVAEVDERSAAGIFYTPRTEIDLMCRLALVDNLANHLGDEHKNLLYEAVFAFEPEEKSSADAALARANLWPPLYDRLRDTTTVDPACGSGSFLVGMLHVLNDLQARAAAQLEISETPYERKKRIIGQSLYGVDVKDWASHVAELRLWLALVVDADFSREELAVRQDPLLPHFTFKIRCGDALVQEVGGINLDNLADAHELSQQVRTHIRQLKEEKLQFYLNKSGSRITEEKLRNDERWIFRTILDERRHKLEEDIKRNRNRIEGGTEARQIGFEGMVQEQPRQLALQVGQWQREIDEWTQQLEIVTRARAAVTPDNQVPFVWQIAFVEIFGSEKDGFDIVVGNPPYVRQESIADPRLAAAQVTADNKRLYKEQLARAVYEAYPSFFGYNLTTRKVARKLDAKSDLYIYFYFLGLHLLNPKGSFCFITSNSWLDVGYGADLQEFLLKHSHVKLVIDNQSKRSFAAADVNTVIVLFSKPNRQNDWGLDKTARFVMFKVPFELILSPIIFEEIESTLERKTTAEYRIYPVNQRVLFEDGFELPSEDVEDVEGNGRKPSAKGPLIKIERYIGNKWGGKYLKAPAIYWTILEKGKGNFARLGSIAQVRFGLKTGANEFFYLDDAQVTQWDLPEHYLKPVIVSPRESASVEVMPEALKFRAFVCHQERSTLMEESVLEYIQWGESQGFHLRPSCSNKARWYEIQERPWARVLWPMIHNDRQTVLWNSQNVIVDHNLFEVLGFDDDLLWGSLAWTGQLLYRELHGRANLGQGALKTEGTDIRSFYVLRVNSHDIREAIRTARQLLASRPIKPVAEESKTDERRALDDIYFNVLGLTHIERDDLYEAVINLVQARLTKATSLAS